MALPGGAGGLVVAREIQLYDPQVRSPTLALGFRPGLAGGFG